MNRNFSDYGKLRGGKLVAATMCPGRFQLKITIVTAWKEELTREVIVMTDFPVTVIKWLFTVVADCGVGVL